jgi:hypothetical protein
MNLHLVKYQTNLHILDHLTNLVQAQRLINLHLQPNLVQDHQILNPHLAINLMIGVIILTGLTGPRALNLAAPGLSLALALFSRRPLEMIQSAPVALKRVKHATPHLANGTAKQFLQFASFI